MEITNKKILVIAPHADDAELGMGATISKLAESNAVDVMVLSMPPKVNQAEVSVEMRKALDVLAVNKVIDDLRYDPREFPRTQLLNYLYCVSQTDGYQIVFLPNSKDIHQSHRATYEEGVRAFKHCTVLGYELPWNSFGFDNGTYVEVKDHHLNAKINAMAHYKTQRNREMFRKPSWAYDLARVRGLQCGRPYAECFETIRVIL